MFKGFLVCSNQKIVQIVSDADIEKHVYPGRTDCFGLTVFSDVERMISLCPTNIVFLTVDSSVTSCLISPTCSPKLDCLEELHVTRRENHLTSQEIMWLHKLEKLECVVFTYFGYSWTREFIVHEAKQIIGRRIAVFAAIYSRNRLCCKNMAQKIIKLIT